MDSPFFLEFRPFAPYAARQLVGTLAPVNSFRTQQEDSDAEDMDSHRSLGWPA